ncbi:hypothetical protein SLE2022_065510 [Rubroshorea leprosula]
MCSHGGGHPVAVRRGKRRSGACLSSCWPGVRVRSAIRGLGRCLFVCCYPVMQCFGWDECRHRHHYPRHFH